MLAWFLAGRGNEARAGAGSRLAGTHTENSLGETRGGEHERPDERVLVAGIGGIHRFDDVADDSATSDSDPPFPVSDGPFYRGARRIWPPPGVKHRVADLLFGGTVFVMASRTATFWGSGCVLVQTRRRRAARADGGGYFPFAHVFVCVELRFCDCGFCGTQPVRPWSSV